MDTVIAGPAIRAAVRRFPLLGRPRPACPALTDRVTEMVEIATNADADDGNGMVQAANALNLAALIASDCGLPNLAHQFCWQHINVYRQLDTLSALQAGYLLEPVLNLARLQTRANDGQPALRLLQAMHQAVTTGTNLTVDGHALPLTGLTGTRDELRQLHQWTWLQHLSEGIRILTLTGRWNDAVQHAATLNGIGRHLMEGRQAVIIAHLLQEDADAARAVLAGSTITEPWEHQVGSCLDAMCPPPGTVDQRMSTLADQFLAQEPISGYPVYRARWGLTVVTLLLDHDGSTAQHVLGGR